MVIPTAGVSDAAIDFAIARLRECNMARAPGS
jgi:hypothetical protein